MTHIMVGPLIYLAASVAPLPQQALPEEARMTAARPVRATAHATATIRIVSGARFGARYLAPVAGAFRRNVRLSNADGTSHSAELLEFQ